MSVVIIIALITALTCICGYCMYSIAKKECELKTELHDPYGVMNNFNHNTSVYALGDNEYLIEVKNT